MPENIQSLNTISSEKITQQYVNEHVERLLKLQAPWALREGPDFAEMNPEQKVVILRGNSSLSSDYREQDIMLASVPKVAINLAMAYLLEELEGLNREVVLDKGALGELFGRDPRRILDNPFYAKLLENPQVREIMQQVTEKKLSDAELDNLKRKLEQLIPEDFEYPVPLKELIYQALKLSSNNATRIAKKLISDNSESINAELAKLVPKYTPSPADMSQLQHWVASKPNVGPLSEHVTLIHSLGQKLKSGTLTPAEEMVISDITNSDLDVIGHDFTHSELGKELISKGYRIIEKTGYYPCVFWIKEFSLPPYNYPPHMILATTVSIVPPEGSDEDVVSFGYYQMYAVRLPQTTEDKNIDGNIVTVPSDLAPYKKAISVPVKNQVNKLFRENIDRNVRQLYTQ